MNTLNGTPHKAKRRRRTNAELLDLDARLHQLAAEHQPCTVRQIYYRAVVNHLCEKTVSGYNLVQRRMLTMRREGRLPYEWIRDNARTHYGRPRYASLQEFALNASRSLYHYDYWADSPVNVEVWVESDSIAGTLQHTVIDDWGLRLHVARGFSSETFLHNAGREIEYDGRPTFVYVLSDFDPSGVSLADDIAHKLVNFSGSVPVQVQRIALDAHQVTEWNLPTHPLKHGDKRAARFRIEHGTAACELEAVPPNMLRQLVADAIAQHVPPGRIEAAKRDEELQREALRQLPEWIRGTS